MTPSNEQTSGPGKPFLTSSEVVDRLGVSKATLYAYVSRGLIRSEPVPGAPRTRRYRADDVERLLNRQRMRSEPETATATALSWGSPVLESDVSFISDGRLYYREHDAVELARTRSVEEVMALIWLGDLDAPLPASSEDGAAIRRDLLMQTRSLADALDSPARVQLLLPAIEQRDPASFDHRPETTRRIAMDIMHLFLNAMVEAEGRSGFARTLQAYWAPGRVEFARLLDAALIVSADHELNVSTFTARCVASAGAPVCSAVAAGLSALRGYKHGGATLQVDAMLREISDPGSAYDVLRLRLQRGEPLPGFGHQLYPHGDPRGNVLLELLREADPGSEAVQLADAVVQGVRELQGLEPNIDFGLAMLSRSMGQPDGTAFALMAMARTIGWIAHIQEEYARDRLIRPRASQRDPEGVQE